MLPVPLLPYTYDIGRYTMRQWHQYRPGCSQPMPVHALYGSNHISGGIGFMPSHEKQPSTASQNFPQDVM
jgi:hypothetical protein